MKPLLTATALSLTSFDPADPLFDTTDAFTTSKFCKAYACEIAGKDVLITAHLLSGTQGTREGSAHGE